MTIDTTASDETVPFDSRHIDLENRGDVHGCSDALEALLDRLDLGPLPALDAVDSQSLESLPTAIVWDGGLVVHGGVDPTRPLLAHAADDVPTMRSPNGDVNFDRSASVASRRNETFRPAVRSIPASFSDDSVDRYCVRTEALAPVWIAQYYN
ncbi:hypothetical protein [Natrinema sp. 74]|uniref:hypothetical protein n=1 Tax=Natrinema sp. 74 TaxID=3384159 RepID=UPI0038D3ACBE